MIPEWINAELKNLGLAGGVIFVLLGTITIMAEIIRRLVSHIAKVTGYRLTERDTLNKALTDTAKVLGDMLDATKDRNDLTEEQADLIAKQSVAFELLKVTVLAQYENIKDNNHVVAQSVSAMAEAIRVLNAMVIDNRNTTAHQVTELKTAISGATSEIREAVRVANQAQIIEIRTILGAEVTMVRRVRPK